MIDMKNKIIILILFISLASISFALTPAGNVTCGQLLDTAGASYTMNASCTINATNGFNVTAVNVSLDCKGWNIFGNNSTATYGIYATNLNTTIKNCNVGNFSTGIYFNTASNGTIQNTTSDTTHASVDPLGYGIYFRANSNNTIINSSGTSTSSTGIRLYTSSNNIISNSTGLSKSGNGIYIASNSHYNTIINSTASSGTTTYGAYLSESDNNSFTLSRFSSVSSVDLYLASTSNGNTICLSNFTATTNNYITDLAGDNFYNCTYNGQNQGNIWANMNSSNLTGTVQSASFPDYKVATGGTSYPYNNSTSGGKFSCNFAGCGDYAPLYYSPSDSDSTSPTVNLLSPTTGTSNTTNSYAFTCNASDNDKVMNLTFYLWNSTTLYYNFTNASATGYANGTIFSNTVSSIPVGNYTWNCKAYDNSSNSNWAALNFTLNVTTLSDTTSPSVNLLSPATGTSSTNTSYNFTCNASDNDIVMNTTFYLWNSTALYYNNSTASITGYANGTVFNYSTSNMPIDNYTWNCLAYDNSSNSAWAAANYTLNVTSLTGNLTVNSTVGGTASGNNSTFIPPANVTINATASTDYAFVNWTTDCNGSILNISNATTQIEVNDNVSCYAQANFEIACGNGICNSEENCHSCVIDCGICPNTGGFSGFNTTTNITQNVSSNVTAQNITQNTTRPLFGRTITIEERDKKIIGDLTFGWAILIIGVIIIAVLFMFNKGWKSMLKWIMIGLEIVIAYALRYIK